MLISFFLSNKSNFPLLRTFCGTVNYCVTFILISAVETPSQNKRFIIILIQIGTSDQTDSNSSKYPRKKTLLWAIWLSTSHEDFIKQKVGSFKPKSFLNCMSAILYPGRFWKPRLIVCLHVFYQLRFWPYHDAAFCHVYEAWWFLKPKKNSNIFLEPRIWFHTYYEIRLQSCKQQVLSWHCISTHLKYRELHK